MLGKILTKRLTGEAETVITLRVITPSLLETAGFFVADVARRAQRCQDTGIGAPRANAERQSADQKKCPPAEADGPDS
jgi:hypothetical protein